MEPSAPRVVAVSGFSGRLLPGPSAVEHDERVAIASVWRQAFAERPNLFDGRILLAESAEVRDGVLHAAFRETPFAMLLWLRLQPPEERRLLNVFGSAAVVTRDGKALLGRMAVRTANAGLVYFPAGTPDLSDVTGDVVDVEGSIVRELAEETGLREPLVRSTARAFVVLDGRLVAYFRRFDSSLDAAALGDRVRSHLAADPAPELDEVMFVGRRDALPAGAMSYAAAAVAPALDEASDAD